VTTSGKEQRASGILKDTWAQVSELYQVIDPLAQKFLFEIPVRPGERQQTPMVLLLGNHSAGKSTFINHLVGKEVQTTGVAPTDDVFTVLMSGNKDERRDGQALIGTPEYGFGDMSRFGPGLVGRMRMRTVSESSILENLMLVDSPGMIDSHETACRSYDFEGVVHWLADRADVVLLLFDPEKPGTTGETLRVLTTSLRGLEHKLIIILNKVDMFDNVHDFARAYGTLCWNLAKVVGSKDLPLIYNSYIPVPSNQHVDSPIDLTPFDKSREDVIREIQRAPERRIDNTVTNIYNHSRQLLMHVQVCQEVARMVRQDMWRWWGYGLGALGISIIAAYGLMVFDHQWWEYGGSILLGMILAFAALKFGEFMAERTELDCIDDLTYIFERLNRRVLEIADQGDLRDLWASLKGRTRKALQTLGAAQIPSMRAAEKQRIEEVIETKVPELRSRIHMSLKNS